MGIFGQTAVQEREEYKASMVDRIIARLKKEKNDAGGRPVEMLKILSSLAIDMFTSYLFEKWYHGIWETGRERDWIRE